MRGPLKPVRSVGIYSSKVIEVNLHSAASCCWQATFVANRCSHAHCQMRAEHHLDIIAGQACAAALFGHRVCCLVQSNDPAIRFEPVGATPVAWNDAEWLDSTRQQDRP